MACKNKWEAFAALGKAITLRSSNFASDVQKKRKRWTGLPCRAGIWEGGQKCKSKIICVHLCVCAPCQVLCPGKDGSGITVTLPWDKGRGHGRWNKSCRVSLGCRMLQAEWKFHTRSVMESFPLSHKGQKGSPWFLNSFSERSLDPILGQWFMSKELYRCNWAFIQLCVTELRMANQYE